MLPLTFHLFNKEMAGDIISQEDGFVALKER
jgi:hypothetical protein